MLNVNIFTSLCAPVFFNPTMDIHMEESKIENSSDHQVSPSLDPSTNETSTGILAEQDEISRDGSNSNTINPNEPVANINSEPPLGEIPKMNSNFGNYYLHIYILFLQENQEKYTTSENGSKNIITF